MSPTENDDEPRGHVLTRRELALLLGAPGLAIVSGWSGSLARAQEVPNCVARPQQTAGPYFVDEALNRSDIRSDPSDGTVKPGAPLEVTFKVSRLSGTTCAPLAGAVVDLWHCDARGIYSDVRDPDFNTVGKKFLRGYQVTDSDGAARFTTIYPGWYVGRTVHAHFKIRSSPSATPGFEFTSQIYFDDALTDEVHARKPYAKKGRRDQRNAGDGIFARGGSQLLPPVVRKGDGYATTFEVALRSV